MTKETTDRRLAYDPTLILLAATLFGCSAGVKASMVGTAGTSGGGAGAGQAGAGAGTAGTTGTGGGGTGTSGTTGSGNSDGGNPADGLCGGEDIGAVNVPLDLYFLMDSSKSMLDATGTGSSKWTAVGMAFDTFFKDPGSAGLNVAVKYFPDVQAAAPTSCTMDTQCSGGGYGNCDRRQTCTGAGSSTTQVSPLCQSVTDCPGTNQACALIKQCGTNSYCAAGPSAPAGACASTCTDFPGYCHLRDICTPAKYATPDVALMTLPGGATALSGSITNHVPDGYTPTGPALKGAIQFAQAQLTSNPSHRVAVVLVTDGLPGGFLPGFPPPECAPSDVATIGSNILMPASMPATAGAPAILTFVVGIFNPASLEGMAAPANLMSLAQAGGTGSPVIIDVTQNDVTQKLLTALKQAQAKAIACSYTIPPPSHGNVDYTEVNVLFGSGANATTIKKTTGPAACSQGGWYYDTDPNTDLSVKLPTQIIACPSTCAMFNANTNDSVEIQLGCRTITVN